MRSTRFRVGRTGTLRLGVVSTAKYFAPRLMAAFQKQHSGIQVELHVANRAKTIEAVKRHDLDIVLMGRPPREVPVRSLIFGEHPFVIIAPAGHPLATRRGITKQEIARERFIIREPGSGTRISLEIFFADIPEKLEDLGAGNRVQRDHQTGRHGGARRCLHFRHTIEQEVQLGRLVILDVQGLPIVRQWFSVSRLDRSVSPAMKAFNEFLVTEGSRYLPVLGVARPAALVAERA